MPYVDFVTSGLLGYVLTSQSDTPAQFGKVPSEVSDAFAQVRKMLSEPYDTSARFGMYEFCTQETNILIKQPEKKSYDVSKGFALRLEPVEAKVSKSKKSPHPKLCERGRKILRREN